MLPPLLPRGCMTLDKTSKVLAESPSMTTGTSILSPTVAHHRTEDAVPSPRQVARFCDGSILDEPGRN
jgi:hypothetical protein